MLCCVCVCVCVYTVGAIKIIVPKGQAKVSLLLLLLLLLILSLVSPFLLAHMIRFLSIASSHHWCCVVRMCGWVSCVKKSVGRSVGWLTCWHAQHVSNKCIRSLSRFLVRSLWTNKSREHKAAMKKKKLEHMVLHAYTLDTQWESKKERKSIIWRDCWLDSTSKFPCSSLLSLAMYVMI